MPVTQSGNNGLIISLDDRILVTGATGFVGTRVVANLLQRGFRGIRCFTRSSPESSKLSAMSSLQRENPEIEIFCGNLLSRQDCIAATRGVSLVIHLAAGRGEKLYPDAFMNSVVTTRNLLDACVVHNQLKRFVNISAFTVYTNTNKRSRNLLDETCPLEKKPERRGEAYCFAKVKQDEIVMDYGKKFGIPYVIVRPGHVYGPGNEAISGRVGVATFGFFLHLGGPNPIPLTYVDNCADAIVLAGLTHGVDGEAFNVVDDETPSSREFLRLYKNNVRRFKSIYLPHILSYRDRKSVV